MFDINADYTNYIMFAAPLKCFSILISYYCKLAMPTVTL